MIDRSTALVPILAFALADLATGQIVIVASRNSSDQQAVGGSSRWPSMSPDARYIAFESDATNLVAGDTNGTTDIFRREQRGGWPTVRVSHGPFNASLPGTSLRPSISANGRFIAYTYIEPPATSRVVVYDAASAQTSTVSVPDGGGDSNGDSRNAAISADGAFIAYTSVATNLVPSDTSPNADCFLRDRVASLNSLVSRNSSGVPANGSSDYTSLAISEDGRFVVFASDATNLDPTDTSSDVDLFLRDTQAGTTELVTVGGLTGTVSAPSISADGRYVVFASDAAYDPADTNLRSDVYLRDRLLGIFMRVSVDSSGGQGNASSGQPAISSTGLFVAFHSLASNLVPGDTNATSDVFVRDLLAWTTARASVSRFLDQGNGPSVRPVVSSDGRFVAFQSAASTLIAGDTNSLDDVFYVDRTCNGSKLTYCTWKVNSLGCGPSIGGPGIPSLSGPDDLHVTATQVLNRKLGLMLWSLSPASTPFFGGTLCVGQPFKRTPGQNSGGSLTGLDCTGTYDYHFTQAYMAQQNLTANTTVYCQFWMRDPGFPSPNNIGLTNGLRFTICP